MTKRPYRSARCSLLFWNATILAVCLFGFCAFFHELLRVRLLALVDTQLSQRSNAVIRLWESVPNVAQEALREEMNGGPFGAVMFIPEDNPTAPAENAIAPDESLTGIYRPRAYSADGKSYIRGVKEAKLDPNAFALAVKGKPVHSTVKIHGADVRVISIPVIVDGDVQFVLQAARGLTEYERELSAVTTDLLRAIPLLLALAIAGGWLLMNRAMGPVRKLRQATEHIEAQDLSQRLPVIGSDEFTLLSETLNHMLGRLDRAFRDQARFIADASHELRTPLTVLRGNTSLALQGDRTAADYRSAIERVHRTIDSMSRLVDELLLLSRADSGQMIHANERVSLSEAVDAAVDATPGREQNPITVTVAERLAVEGSLDLLIRLFANLLSNAVRHTESDKQITVTIRRELSEAVIVIEDEGEGIAPDHLPHVTERFYRADSARSGHGGSGLGLAICQSIVTAHGGTMEIESTVGHSTRVTVRLPAA